MTDLHFLFNKQDRERATITNLQQHGFDVKEDSEGTDREKKQCSSVQPSVEAIIAPSHSDIAIEVLSKEDLVEIQEEVPQSEPDAAVNRRPGDP